MNDTYSTHNCSGKAIYDYFKVLFIIMLSFISCVFTAYELLMLLVGVHVCFGTGTGVLVGFTGSLTTRVLSSGSVSASAFTQVDAPKIISVIIDFKVDVTICGRLVERLKFGILAVAILVLRSESGAMSKGLTKG